ncbi:hypothetical protein AMTR_s00056p00216960, partial [Amborella trichopoda]
VLADEKDANVVNVSELGATGDHSGLLKCDGLLNGVTSDMTCLDEALTNAIGLHIEQIEGVALCDSQIEILEAAEPTENDKGGKSLEMLPSNVEGELASTDVSLSVVRSCVHEKVHGDIQYVEVAGDVVSLDDRCGTGTVMGDEGAIQQNKDSMSLVELKLGMQKLDGTTK